MDTAFDWQSRWKHETKCSVRELAKLCHGWDPDSDVLPDPVLYNTTVARILPAVRLETLHPIAVKFPLTAEDFFCGEGPFFCSARRRRGESNSFPHSTRRGLVRPGGRHRPIHGSGEFGIGINLAKRRSPELAPE